MPVNLYLSEKTAAEPIISTQVGRVLPFFDHIRKFAVEWINSEDDQYCYCYIEKEDISSFCNSFCYEGTNECQEQEIKKYLELLKDVDTLYVRIE